MRPATIKGEAWAIELERGTGKLLASPDSATFPIYPTRLVARTTRRMIAGWPKARVVRVKVRIEVVA